MKTHREMYPEQYSHPIVGKTVSISNSAIVGKVSRVVGSRFGMLVILEEHGNDNAWPIESAAEIDAGTQRACGS